MNEYKTFAQNGGFGPAFGNTGHQTYEEKVRIISFLIYLYILLFI
jgi:hypothetical protein